MKTLASGAGVETSKLEIRNSGVKVADKRWESQGQHQSAYSSCSTLYAISLVAPKTLGQTDYLAVASLCLFSR
jgi:hypothetical protein